MLHSEELFVIYKYLGQFPVSDWSKPDHVGDVLTDDLDDKDRLWKIADKWPLTCLNYNTLCTTSLRFALCVSHAYSSKFHATSHTGVHPENVSIFM